MYLVAGLVLLLISIPDTLEECTLRLENVNCTDQEITNIHYTCETKSIENDCLCTFENPLQSELGLYKMCKTKSDLTSRKKKVRKRQIEERELKSCGAIQPPRPGKASCIVSQGETICIGTCETGYRFVDGAKEHPYSCRFSEGVWKPDAVFPACEPECIPSCQNGGNCTVPNFCSCSNDYRGENCEYTVKLCGLSRNLFASTWKCNHTRRGTTCDISCHPPGTTEAEIDVQRYECSVEGMWASPLPPCVQVVRKCDDPGTIEFGHRISMYTEFPLGSMVSYECNEGYTISGNPTMSCQKSGQWSSEKPLCIYGPKVPEPVPVERDRTTGPHLTITEQCTKPRAPKNSIVHVSFPGHNPLQTLFNSNLPLFQKLYISLIANSSQTSDSDLASLPEELFQSGTRVQYKCKSRFYKLYGSQYQTCLSSRTWSGYQPACVPECGKSDSPKMPFIVNGDRSLIGQWPWIVALAIKSSKGLQLMCGGVLISETWVLTAAHCVTKRLSNSPMNASSLLVFCGKYFRKFVRDDEYVQAKQVKQIIVHDEYDFIHYDTDIALLQLEDVIELTTRVQPICLPTEVTTRENIRDGQKGMVLGWGLNENGTYPETLRETILPVVSHDKCEAAYREGLRTVTITRNMFCAGHESGFSDTCHGDSGGPFMFSVGPANDKRWYLEGLVSWGSESGCAKANRYSGFTKVGRFVPWINMFI